MSITEEVVSYIPKNAHEEIRIAVAKYNNTPFVNLRMWWEDNNHDWKPGKQGIALQPQALDSVIEGLQKAKALLTKTS